MRLPRRASLLLLALLLTSAATAHAEFAWVEWIYQLVKGAGGFEQYSVGTAHATRRECEQSVRDYAPALKSDGYRVTGGFPGSKEVFGEKDGTRYRYFCLPDTVDPRGAKGK
jgi:hypothetical protein